jgi:CPA2 family monovalent cation:H+ antiporter-2
MGDLSTPAKPGHAIVIGYGVPGRSFVDWAVHQGLSYCVIETNGVIVDRCSATGIRIMTGDARDPSVLERAGIDRATIVAISVPDETGLLEIISAVRPLNKTARMIVRCAYVSTGFEAVKRGADDTVVAEELAAREFVRLAGGARSSIRSNSDGPNRPHAVPVTA